ncbi:MAG: hypothetical protein J7K30_07420 [Deltaproteobacteria bacterium]|nr:hypothetical protein [Deltaproteobacteria bacterium]
MLKIIEKIIKLDITGISNVLSNAARKLNYMRIHICNYGNAIYMPWLPDKSINRDVGAESASLVRFDE